MQGLPGPKSSLTKEQVADLVRMGVLEEKRRSDPGVLNVCKAFTVPKANGKNRLVVDASRVGEGMVEPPYTRLPALEEIKEAIAANAFAVQLDGKSWFYQVGAKALKRYFAVRTVAGVYFLVVLLQVHQPGSSFPPKP